MTSRIVTVLVGVLAVALVAGMAFVLLRPAESVGAVGLSQGRGGQDAVREPQSSARALSAQGAGYGAAGSDRDDTMGGAGDDYGAGGGRGQSVSPAEPRVDHETDWEVLTGEVVVVDSEMVVRTDDGRELLVGLGQSSYREAQGFALEVGDRVTVEGFYEDGEFKAGTLQNLATGEALVLRDTTGRPMWAGAGRGQNRN